MYLRQSFSQGSDWFMTTNGRARKYNWTRARRRFDATTFLFDAVHSRAKHAGYVRFKSDSSQVEVPPRREFLGNSPRVARYQGWNTQHSFQACKMPRVEYAAFIPEGMGVAMRVRREGKVRQAIYTTTTALAFTNTHMAERPYATVN